MKRPQHSSYLMPVEDAEELARELSEFGYGKPPIPTRPSGDVTTRSRSGTPPSCTSRCSCTPATTLAGHRLSSPPRRSAGRAAATPCVRTSACSTAGRAMALSARPSRGVARCRSPSEVVARGVFMGGIRCPTEATARGPFRSVQVQAAICPMPPPATVHASAVLVGPRSVLIRGPSCGTGRVQPLP